MNTVVGLYTVADTVTDVVTVPWWAYLVGLVIVAALGVTVRLFVLPLQQAQSGKWMPRSTVDLIIKGKDDEIARALKDAENWQTAYNIQASAYTELAETAREAARVIDATGVRHRAKTTIEEAPNGRPRQRQLPGQR